MAHFLSPCKEQINFLRLGLDIFLSLGFLIFGAAPWLAPSGGSGLRLHASPENSYFCRGEFICASLRELPSFSFPRHLPKRNEMTGGEAREGQRQNWFLLIHAARGTLHLIWPSISRNDLNIFCVKQRTGRFLSLRQTLNCSLPVL